MFDIDLRNVGTSFRARFCVVCGAEGLPEWLKNKGRVVLLHMTKREAVVSNAMGWLRWSWPVEVLGRFCNRPMPSRLTEDLHSQTAIDAVLASSGWAEAELGSVAFTLGKLENRHVERELAGMLADRLLSIRIGRINAFVVSI